MNVAELPGIMLNGKNIPRPGLPPFEVHMQSGNEATRRNLIEVLKSLAPLDLEPEELSTVELVLAEVLNNIVEHAYPADCPAGPIRTRCQHLADGLHFTISDQGFAMPGGATPLGFSPNVDVELDDLPEGGFGWFLIKDLAKDIHYDRRGSENQLKFRIAVGYARKPH
jgi:serine/threonine-protein kinase RsbW